MEKEQNHKIHEEQVSVNKDDKDQLDLDKGNEIKKNEKNEEAVDKKKEKNQQENIKE